MAFKDKFLSKSPFKNYKNPGDYKVFNFGNEPASPMKKSVNEYSVKEWRNLTQEQKKRVRKDDTARKPKRGETPWSAFIQKNDDIAELESHMNEEQRIEHQRKIDDYNKGAKPRNMDHVIKNIENSAKNIRSKIDKLDNKENLSTAEQNRLANLKDEYKDLQRELHSKRGR